MGRQVMNIPWRRLAKKLGKWLLRKAADEALKELQKRKEQGK
jgi:chaperonin cofactor prefoldin